MNNPECYASISVVCSDSDCDLRHPCQAAFIRKLMKKTTPELKAIADNLEELAKTQDSF